MCITTAVLCVWPSVFRTAFKSHKHVIGWKSWFTRLQTHVDAQWQAHTQTHSEVNSRQLAKFKSNPAPPASLSPGREHQSKGRHAGSDWRAMTGLWRRHVAGKGFWERGSAPLQVLGVNGKAFSAMHGSWVAFLLLSVLSPHHSGKTMSKKQGTGIFPGSDNRKKYYPRRSPCGLCFKISNEIHFKLL